MKAFTLIELLIVIGISVVLVGISAGGYTALNRKSSVDTETRKLESVLNLARNRTLASGGGQRFGVHIDSSAGEYILFPGSSYVSSNPDNEKFEIPRQVSFTALTLNGGGSDIIFDRLTGATSQFGSLVLSRTGSASRMRTVCIEGTGAIEVRSTCQISSIEYTTGITDADLASFPANSGFGDPAQSFTTGAVGIYAREASLYIKRTGGGPSDTYVEIREASTIGSVIGRSWMVAGSSLPASLGWVSFVFPDPVFLVPSTQYFLRLRSLPDSTIAFSNATGTIHWGYEHASSAPPAYTGGDAWRRVGGFDNPADEGEQLGPADQYDFSFRILYGIDPPPSRDSRHMEFDLADTNDRGWTIQGASTLTLTFHDPPNPDVIENVPMASYFDSGSTIFDWSGSVDVSGDTETLRVHTHYIDANDTTLSIHRDRGINQKAIDISIDGRDIVSYAADGTPGVGIWGGNMIYR